MGRVGSVQEVFEVSRGSSCGVWRCLNLTDRIGLAHPDLTRSVKALLLLTFFLFSTSENKFLIFTAPLNWAPFFQDAGEVVWVKPNPRPTADRNVRGESTYVLSASYVIYTISLALCAPTSSKPSTLQVYCFLCYFYNTGLNCSLSCLDPLWKTV